MQGTERKQQLVKLLESTLTTEPLPIGKLADSLGVSTRTIRYDLEHLQEEFAREGLLLCRKPGLGVWLEHGESQEKPAADEYVPDPKERRNRIIIAMLEQHVSSVDELASLLKVSKATLLHDLKAVQELFERRGLTYGSKRGFGIWAEGSELNIRDTLIHVFARYMYDFRDFEHHPLSPLEEPFRTYAKELPIQAIADTFLSFFEESGLKGTDQAVNRMIIALTVQLHRLRYGNLIDGGRKVDFLQDEGVSLEQAAEELARSMTAFHPAFSRPEEVQALPKELMHSRIYQEAEAPASQEASREAAVHMAREFVTCVQSWLGEDYSSDQELLYNLALHLQPAIERAYCGIVFTNPLLTQIQQQYHDLFRIAAQAAGRITEGTGIHLSEDEIGYLTIHLGAAVERHKAHHDKELTVLLVCSNGIGLANLLEMTLKHHMPFIRIVRKISYYQLQETDFQDVDLVISTISLELPEKAVLRISPILTDAEIAIIEKQLRYMYNKKYPIASGRSPLPSAGHGLCTALQPQAIELHGKADDWETAVRMAGGLLQKAGAVDARYIDGMVTCIKKLGPYSVVAPGIAMPHARPEDGARRVAASFLRLEQPVDFGTDGQHIPVDILIAFSAVDTVQHLELLRDLWHLLMQDSAAKELRKIPDAKALLAFLAAFLQAQDELQLTRR